MATGRQIQKKGPSNATQTPATGMFKPRPFAMPAGPEAVTAPELQTKAESGQIGGSRLARIDVSAPPPIQPKLTIGAPGDKYEQEADTIARKVVKQISTPTPPDANGGGDAVQRQMFSTPSIMKLTVQRREAVEGGAASSDLESTISQARSSGTPLGEPIRRQMEGAFGADFSGVRVHTNNTADTLNRSLSARAFTTGNNIFFKQGEYNTSSSSGKELLAHELTHVVQQNPVSGPKVARKTLPLVQSKAIGNSSLVIQRWGLTKWAKDKAKQATSWAGNKVDQAKTWAGEKYDQAKTWAGEKYDQAKTWAKQKQIEINNKLTAGNSELNSKLAFLGETVEDQVPNDGDATTFSAEIRVPVDPSATAFLGFKLSGSAERSDVNIKLRTEVGILGGGSKKVAEIVASLGGYLEVQGISGIQAMNLISYVLYRQFAESNVPYEIEAYLWGGSTSQKGRAAAHDWSKKVEDTMDDNAYAEVGGYASISAKVELGENAAGFEAEASAQGSMGAKYSKASIEAARRGGKDEIGSRGGFFDKVAGLFERGARGSIGQRVFSANVGLNASVKLGSFSLGGGGSFGGVAGELPETLHQKTTKMGILGLKYAVKVKGSVPSEGWLGTAAGCVDQVADNVTKGLRLLGKSWSSRDNAEAAKLTPEERRKQELEIAASSMKVAFDIKKAYKERSSELAKAGSKEIVKDGKKQAVSSSGNFGLEIAVEGSKERNKTWGHELIFRKATDSKTGVNGGSAKINLNTESSSVIWKHVIKASA